MLLKNVITKYERVAKEMPKAMKAAHAEAFAEYQANLQQVAFDALSAVIDEKEREAANRFVETFTAENTGVTMKFVLRAPRSGEELNREITADDVEAWVRAGAENQPQDNRDGKVFDSRDASVDEVVRKMQGILIYASGKKLGESQQAARNKYLPFIREFISRGGVTEAKILLWSKVIVCAWLNYVHVTWPNIARNHLRELLNS